MSNWMTTRYEDVFAYIQAGIRDGALTPGERLVGERKLAEQLGLSRETVRIGLNMAEESGLIVRIPQRGTFVANPKVRQDLGKMVTFNRTVRDLSMNPAYLLHGANWVALDDKAAARLEVAAGSRALMVEVTGLANGLPLALYRSYLPEALIAEIGEDHAWGEKASYEFAALALGAPSLTVEQELEAITLPREQALALKVRVGAPGFFAQSVFSTPAGRRVELRTTWYPGARYRFNLTRTIQI